MKRGLGIVTLSAILLCAAAIVAVGDPIVSSVVSSDLLVSDADAGGSLTVTVEWSEAMNTGVGPTLAFSPDVASTLTFSSDAWPDSDTYQATYAVSDANVDVHAVTVDVTGAQDALGNPQQDYTPETEFAIDTLNPGAVSVTPNLAVIMDADVGTATFTLTVVYDEAMDTGVAPAITFPVESPSAMLTPNAGASSWTDSVTYIGKYDVADVNVLLPDVDVRVSGAQDAAGNAQAVYDMADLFDIDTRDRFTITASAGEHGSIDPVGAVTVISGDDQAFTITPAACYHVADVVVDGSSVGAVTSYTFEDVAAAHTIAASFALDSYTIAASAGENGSISPSGDVVIACGSDQAFAFTPAEHYHVADVLVDGSSVGAVPSYTFTNVTAAHTIAVTFAIDTYTITAIARTAYGTISPNGAVSVPYGGSQTFTMTPDTYCQVGEYWVDGVSMGIVARPTPADYTFTNVTGAHIIEVFFWYGTPNYLAVGGAGVVGANGFYTYAGVIHDQAYYQKGTYKVSYGEFGRPTEWTLSNGATRLYWSTSAPGTCNWNVINSTYSPAPCASGGQTIVQPTISSMTPSHEWVADSTVGTATFSLTAVYSEAMDTAVSPTFTLPDDGGGAPTNTMKFNVSQSGWTDSTTYVAKYDVVDVGQDLRGSPNAVDVTVTGAKNLAGLAQVQVTAPNLFSIDTQNPTYSLALSHPNYPYDYTSQVVMDSYCGAAPAEGLHAIIAFSEGMDAAYTPAISFPAENPGGTLTFNGTAEPRGWYQANGKDVYYHLWYDVADLNTTLLDIDVRVTNARDEHGNPVTPEVTANRFTIDTENPTVLSVTANDTLLTDADVGSAKVTLTIVYSERVRGNTPIAPTVSFPVENPGSALVFNSAESIWSTTNTTYDTYVAKYDVVDTNNAVASIDVGTSGARDARDIYMDIIANLQVPHTGVDKFSIDLQNPTVVSVTPSVTWITDAQVGTGTFSLTLAYSEAMNTSVAPTVAFPAENPSGTLTFNASQSGWTDTTTYVASYDVVDADVLLPDIDVRVTGAKDAAGNTQPQHNIADRFGIDTSNPTYEIIVSAPYPSSCATSTISDAFSGTAPTRGIYLTVLFHTDVYGMNQSAPWPQISLPTEDPYNTLTYSWTAEQPHWDTPNAPTLWGPYWYDVDDVNEIVRDIDVLVTGARDEHGNPMVSAVDTDVFSIDTLNPTVVSMTPSKTTITDADVGTGTFSLTLVYSEDVRGSHLIAPTVSFPVENPASVLSYNSGQSGWADDTTYVAKFDIIDTGASLPDVDVQVAGARDALDGGNDLCAGNLQVPYEAADQFSIDLQNPTVVSVTPSVTWITDAQVGIGTFSLTLAYSEAMNTSTAPTIAFPVENPSGTITLNAGASGWTDSTTYVAAYDVVDANTLLADIDVRVTGAKDLVGNTQPQYDGADKFGIDTLNPTVLAVTVSDLVITDADAGGTFKATVDWSEAMDGVVLPALTFAPDVSSTLSFTSGTWTDSDTYQAAYGIANASLDIDAVSIDVANAQDAVGNPQQDYTPETEFGVDTLNPAVVSVTPNLVTIMDGDVGTATFWLTIIYDEAMDAAAPAVAFPTEDPDSTLTPNAGASGWTDSTTYVAKYNVADVNALLTDIDVRVSGGQDVAGNLQAAYDVADLFDIDTRDRFTITASSGEHGSIDPAGAVVVISGDDQAFTMTPAEHYHIADVVVDSVSVGAVADYTFEDVAASHTISVTFAIDTYTITASAGANGTISPSGAVVLNYDASQTFAIAAATNHHIESVVVDSAPVGTPSSYTFSNVSADHTIAASFDIDHYNDFVVGGAGYTAANGFYTHTGFVNDKPTWTKGSFSIYWTGSAWELWGSGTKYYYTTSVNPVCWGCWLSTNSAYDPAPNPCGGDLLYGPRVVSCTPSHDWVSEPLVGTATFVVTFSYDQLMDPMIQPTIDLPSEYSWNPDDTLTLNVGQSGWTSDTTYVAKFNVVDANQYIAIGAGPSSAVNFNVSGAKNLAGTTQHPLYYHDLFQIDTVSPTYSFSMVHPAVPYDWAANVITDPCAGPAGLRVVVTFSEAMNPSYTPAISFPNENPEGTLSPTPAPGVWLNSVSYMVYYDVADLNVVKTDIDVKVSGARDSHGNPAYPEITYDRFDIDTVNPTVLSITPSKTVLADADVGAAALTLTIVFSEPVWYGHCGMWGPAPTITFPDVDPGLSLVYNEAQSGFYPIGGSDYFIARYDLVDLGMPRAAIDVRSTDVLDVPACYSWWEVGARNPQVVPYDIAGLFTIDTQNPTVVSVTPSVTWITDATAGTATFSLTVVYSEAMSDGTAPTVSFPTENPTGTLTFNAGVSTWTDSTTYVATYDVVDANALLADIDVRVTGGKDALGNLQVPYDGADVFGIDTLNPAVLGVGVSDLMLSDANAGGTFTVTVDWSEAMDAGVAPTLSFAPDVATTLALSGGSWPESDTYEATFDISDANIDVDSVSIDVAGAHDARGNAQQDYAPETEFGVDTLNPGSMSVTPNVACITDAAVGTATFWLTVVYSEAMGAGAPTITFPAEDPSATLTPNAGASGWTNTTTYVAKYDVTDVDALLENIDVQVSGARDAAGNVQGVYDVADVFSIDTRQRFTITASAGPHGSIDPVGTVQVVAGSDQTFAIAAEAHYHIADVVVDSVSVGAVASYTFEDVAAPHTIEATFAIDTYTITASAGAHGAIDPLGAVVVEYSADQAFTIAPDPCYHVADVLVDGVSVGPVDAHSFFDVFTDHTIAAEFALNRYTITASAGPGGTIDPSGALELDCGASQTYTITPAACYHIVDVVVDGVSVGPVETQSFFDVFANHTIAATFEIDTYTIAASSGANGTIDPAGNVVVNCGEDQVFSIVPAACHHIADVLVDGVSVGPVDTYSFFDVFENHTIAAAFEIDTHTITASAGAHGAISPSGAVVVDCGANRTFTITPDACYHIADVLVDGVSVGPVDTYSFFDVFTEHTIAATFEINVYTIAASAGPNGAIDPSGDVVVVCGTDQTFTFVPDVHHHVADVVVDGVSVGAVTSHTFLNVTEPHTVAATFAIDTYTITATAGEHGAVDPSGAVIVLYGADQTFTITPDAHYHIADVVVDGASIGPVTVESFFDVFMDHTLVASFAVDQHTLTTSVAGSGTIAPSGGVYDYGTLLDLTALPDMGWGFTGWDGDLSGSTNPASLVMDGDKTVSATFSLLTYTIAASAGANGTISPSGTATVAYGDTPTYTFTPAAGYHVRDVVVDGVSLGVLDQYTFPSVTANHTIAVVFTRDHVITATAGPNGTITPSGAVWVAYGATQKFIITPASGYHVASVVVDGVSKGALTSYTFTSVIAPHTITATFAINTYTIAATASRYGTISPKGIVIVEHGASQTFTITPNEHYHVLRVLVDGRSIGAVTEYTFTNVTALHRIAAIFAIDTFPITASAGPNGTITPSGTVAVPYNTSRAFTIAAKTGYHIEDVLVDGVSVGAVRSYTFLNVMAPHTIAAVFHINPRTITASAGANGTISPKGAIPVEYGASQAFTITPNAHYHVLKVLVDGKSVGAVTDYAFTNVIVNHTIAASFTIDTFPITASAGPNGTITPSGTAQVNYGTNKTYTITPAAGHHIDDVLVDGVSVGAVTKHTFTAVSGPHTIAASFAPGLAIGASCGPHGAISPAGTSIVPAGTTLVVTLTPDPHYHVATLVVDGLAKPIATSYTFANITASHTIVATFALDTVTITATTGAGGTIAPRGTVPVGYGTDKTFTMAPNAHYHVADVKVDGVSVGPVPSYTFTNVTAPHTIAATFAIDTVTIAASAGPNGTITPSGAVAVNYGASRSFAITAASHYHVADVLVDGVSVGARTSYSFTAVTAPHTIEASFAINTYNLSATAGANGTISPSGTTAVAYGGSQTYTMTPAEHYHVALVKVDGISVGAVTEYTFTNVTAPHTIAVTFALDTYPITSSAGTGGTISPRGTVNVAHGASKIYAITAASGYHVHDVLVDGVSVGPVTRYTFTNVTAPHTIEASFAAGP